MSDGLLPLDLLESGDVAFVDAIRAVSDAEFLAGFAGDWIEDPRPGARRLLLEYLDRPLDAFRHEGLIKRLFKKAEASGDDAVMARFLVTLDRSIRRRRKVRRTWLHEVAADEAEAQAWMVRWSALGYRSIEAGQAWNGQRYVRALKAEEVVVQPRGTTMPRDRRINHRPEYRLFRVATRNYLRRRAWRYFRKLGRTDPGRYVLAATEALTLYRDEDVADGLALIDNWGLTHILFHHCPAIEAKAGGWAVRPGHSLGELAPAPIFETAWDASPDLVIRLVLGARSRTVRRWATRRVEADPATYASRLPVEGWLGLLGHDDADLVALAADMLDRIGGLESVGVARWLSLAESTHPVALDAICGLIARHVRADQVAIDQAIRLAGLRPLPVARLGLAWLQARTIEGPGDLRAIFRLVDAESDRLRPEILDWLRAVATASDHFEPAMVLEFLDSRHPDVRAVGWRWFLAEARVGHDVEAWRKLLESPHDEIRLALIADLESREAAGSSIGRELDPEVLRGLWASVLLNIHRGHRARPTVVRQLLRRLESNPGEASLLIPLLGLAMRSIRGPEHRAGLVAIVRFLEGRADAESLVLANFPELQLS